MAQPIRLHSSLIKKINRCTYFGKMESLMSRNASPLSTLLRGAVCAGILLSSTLALAAAEPKKIEASAENSVLLAAMKAELNRAVTDLTKGAKADQPAPYYISYSAEDTSSVVLSAQSGALITSRTSHYRLADIQVRVGSPALDNTHGTHRSAAVKTVRLPLTDDKLALESALWVTTNSGYATALDNYTRVKTEQDVRAKEEDNSPDFSKEKPEVSVGKLAVAPKVDTSEWQNRIRTISQVLRQYPDVYLDQVQLMVASGTSFYISSEGAQIVYPQTMTRLVVVAISRAEDGMDLYRVATFESEKPEGLPSMEKITADVKALGESLEALRKAPLTTPFNGPAILSGRAAAVFFHEVLGHRLEGQRQRGDEEGQTFTKQLGKSILPEFLSVADDPTMDYYGSQFLSGQYPFDDEGVKAQRVPLVEKGVLKNFLMSRLPIASFSQSNGHGRAQSGHVPAGRQGNLIVTSTKTVTDAELRKQLIEEAKKQNKSFGLYFEDISSGFAVTTRNSPQAFSVIPLVVYRVYVDGRPDELVRGVSIVGTPMAALNRIQVTSDSNEVFNGECGAESGSIPVSAVAPAMLVSEIETQRQEKGISRPPILPRPGAEPDTATTVGQKEVQK
jgi:predicted Zn-dependent protease